MSRRAASEYVNRMEHLRLELDPREEHRRLTSLYFPPGERYEIAPRVLVPEDVPTLKSIFTEAFDVYKRFLKEYDYLLNDRTSEEKEAH